MSADQSAAELTTRDVLLQVDRRLTLIESDLRSLDEKLDDKIDGLRGEMNAQNASLRSEIATQNASLRTELNDRFSRIDNKFWLQIGLIMSSWISLVVLLLSK